MTSSELLQQLCTQVSDLLQVLSTEIEPRAAAALQFKATPASWSVLECLEHLNRYSRFYNPALRKALAVKPSSATHAEVGFSWLGRKSYEMVRPENRKLQKTLKHMNPSQSALNPKAVLTEFRQHQETLLELLRQAENADLNRKGVPVEFFRLLKLRVGEALLFVVAHQERHVQQAQRALQQYVAQRETAPRLVI
ncbi:DinB family protein [Hymenobacter lutimineralis]|uniref:DinB family protein n=1 Tax=Hymenobacter lutimineralis TaxID=2606448 RepID=A0A5D6UZ46_9BACT|nr:DinB family protein [Hymenobacter lutimineralis]TYZ08873.1 DinB family protein [Hymenobacter lutimineralis]